MVCLLKILTLDRKSTRLNSSHTVIYTLSLHDALPICKAHALTRVNNDSVHAIDFVELVGLLNGLSIEDIDIRSEEHTSELQSHRDLHSFPTRRSSDLQGACTY